MSGSRSPFRLMALGAAAVMIFAACSSTGSSAAPSAAAPSAAAPSAAAPSAAASVAADAKTATSAADMGGMDAVCAAAKTEGTLNVIALPPDWANYGQMINDFTAKYGIKVKSDQPDVDSQTRSTPPRTSPARAGARRLRPRPRRSRWRTPTCSRRTRSPPGPTSPTRTRSRPASGSTTTPATCRSATTPSSVTSPTSGRPAQARVQGQGRPQRRPAEGGAPASTAWSWPRSPTAARPTTSPPASTSSRSSTTAGNLPAGRPDPGDDRLGTDAVRHRLGVQQRGQTAKLAPARASTGRSSIPTDAPPVASYYNQAINKDAPHPAAARLLGGVPLLGRRARTSGSRASLDRSDCPR